MLPPPLPVPMWPNWPNGWGGSRPSWLSSAALPHRRRRRLPRSGEKSSPRQGTLQPGPLAPLPAGALTTAELAERTGTNRAAWNNWARDKKPGAVRKMPPEVGSWRLAGKGPGPNGGPERWLWEPA